MVDVTSRMNARKNHEDLAEWSVSIGRSLVHQESDGASPPPLWSGRAPDRDLTGYFGGSRLPGGRRPVGLNVDNDTHSIVGNAATLWPSA